MSKFTTFKNITRRLTNYSLAIGMGWVLVMMFLTTFDIAGRYFFSKPIPGTIELSEFMLAIFGITGIAYTHQAGGNVRVTMLVDALPLKWAALTNTVTNILSLAIVALLAWYGFVAGIEEFHAGTTTDSLGIPIYPLKFLLAISAFLLSLEITISLIESVRSIFRIENSM
ncbi:MAG: TRAP transporter small permease [Desulfobacterales bacterium]|nr:TRAP transporter small permease [Desulfobacterales bacterium]